MRDRRTDRQKNAALPRDEIVQNSSADFLSNLWPASAPRRGGLSPVNDPWSRLGLDLGSCGSLLRSRHPSLEHHNENREIRDHSPLVRGLSLESVYSNLSYHRQMNQNARFDPNSSTNPSNFLDVSYQHTSPETVKQTWSTGDSDIFSPSRNQPNYSPFRVDNRNREDIMQTSQDRVSPVQLNLRLDRQQSFENWSRNGKDVNRNDEFCDFGYDENDWGKRNNDQLVRSPVSKKLDPGRQFSENDDLKTRIKKLVHGKEYHTLNHADTPTKSNSFPYPREEQSSPSPDIDHQYDQWARTQSPTKLSLAWSPLKFLDNDPLIGAPLVSTPPSTRNQWEGAVDSILRDSCRSSSPNGKDSSPEYTDGNESSLFQRTLTFQRAARPRFSSDVRQPGSSSGPRSPGDFRLQSPGKFNHENPTPVRKRDRPRFLSDNTETIPAATNPIHERRDIDNALFAEFDAPSSGSLFDRNSRRTASARINSHRARPQTSTSPKRETLNKSYSHDPLAWNPNGHVNLDKDIRSLTLRLKKSLDSLYHPQDDLDNREDATLIYEEQGRPASPRFNINSWSPNNADVPRYKNRIKACQSSPVIFSASHTFEKDPVELKFANGFHTLQINRNKDPPEELAKLGPNRIKGSDFGAGRFRCTPVHEERGKTVYLDCPDSDSSDPSEEKVATIITFQSVSAA